MKQQSKAPVSKNQELELVIEGWGSRGEGIGRYCQFAIFVPGALPGETVRIRIVKVWQGVACSDSQRRSSLRGGSGRLPSVWPLRGLPAESYAL